MNQLDQSEIQFVKLNLITVCGYSIFLTEGLSPSTLYIRYSNRLEMIGETWHRLK